MKVKIAKTYWCVLIGFLLSLVYVFGVMIVSSICTGGSCGNVFNNHYKYLLYFIPSYFALMIPLFLFFAPGMERDKRIIIISISFIIFSAWINVIDSSYVWFAKEPVHYLFYLMPLLTLPLLFFRKKSNRSGWLYWLSLGFLLLAPAIYLLVSTLTYLNLSILVWIVFALNIIGILVTFFVRKTTMRRKLSAFATFLFVVLITSLVVWFVSDRFRYDVVFYSLGLLAFVYLIYHSFKNSRYQYLVLNGISLGFISPITFMFISDDFIYMLLLVFLLMFMSVWMTAFSFSLFFADTDLIKDRAVE